jgi:phage regulator Rha-like protein
MGERYFVTKKDTNMEIVHAIQSRIYGIRGERVMLDADLAALYGTETKRLKEAVKRNIRRFPSDFMFQLTKAERDALRSQIAALEIQELPGQAKKPLSGTGRGQYSKYLPHAFTEHGVTMLASVLNSDKAVKMNIAIVRAFIAMRGAVIQNREILNLLLDLRDRVGEHDVQLKHIYDALENLLDENAMKVKWEERERIGYKTG